ncbi:MAG: OmpA family protein [Gammaproteobacteria bacterium]|nr:OmpA family protein [Gammaproteobacteria bacterium]
MEVPSRQGATAKRSSNGAAQSPGGQRPAPKGGDNGKEDLISDSINKDVFDIGGTFHDMRGAPPTHWSVTWSDLMMTMFILFMTLYVYQMAGQSFQEADQEASDAMQQDAPFYVPGGEFSPGDGGAANNLQSAQDEEASLQVDGRMPRDLEREKLEAAKQGSSGLEAELSTAWKGSPEHEQPGDELNPSTDLRVPKDAPIPEDKPEVLSKLFDLSKYTLTQEKLQRFASVDVVPNKAVRIILTGDLLFPPGQAVLAGGAEDALSKLAPVLRRIPYMINVVGHTDSTPMYSAQFPSNWELSVARASSVVRFLMDEMEIPGRQLVASGYAYYRPVMPNNSVTNRARNRRVEIIISKELPDAIPATSENIR